MRVCAVVGKFSPKVQAVFELTEAQIKNFAVHKASYLPEQVRTSRTFLPAIREHVRSLSELEEPTVCARRQESRERVLLHDGAKVIIGGVRFKNLDPNFPFVELNANFDLLESTADVALETEYFFRYQ